jgi:hypothetical protein
MNCKEASKGITGDRILFPGMMVRIDKIESTVLAISSAYSLGSADELTKYNPCPVDIYVYSSAFPFVLVTSKKERSIGHTHKYKSHRRNDIYSFVRMGMGSV